MRIVFRDFEEIEYLVIDEYYNVLAIFSSYNDASFFIYSKKRLTA